MKSKTYRILDLFCGAGGCAVGYHRAFTAAGYDVEITGVDIAPQKHYPFRFIQGDAMTFPLDGYDFIHASPPCQGYSVTKVLHPTKEHPLLLEPTRLRLMTQSTPWIIENVSGAPMGQFVELCGTHFGLKVYRHRQFESSHMLFSPCRCTHPNYLLPGFVSICGHRVKGRATNRYHNQYPVYPSSYGKEAMGIDWKMNRDELDQAIPPAYTEWLGRQILTALESEAA